MTYTKHALVVGISLVLAACGGGGGSSASSDPSSAANGSSTSTGSGSTGSGSTGSGSSGSNSGGSNGGTGSSTISACSSGGSTTSSGHYFYAGTGAGSSTIQQYTINSNGGLSLTSTAPALPVNTVVNSMIVHPSGKFAYTTSQTVGSGGSILINQYSVGANGALTPLATASVATDLMISNTNLAFDATGKYLFIAGQNSGGGVQIYGFSIGSDGSLTPASTLNIAVNANLPTLYANSIQSIAVNPVTNTLEAILQITDSSGANPNYFSLVSYPIGANGVLSGNGSSGGKINSPDGTIESTFLPSIIVDPSGQSVFINEVVNLKTPQGGTQNEVFSFTSEQVTDIGTLPETGHSYTNFVIDSSGQYAYAISQTSNTISQFNVAANGTLTPMTIPTVSTLPNESVMSLNVVGGNLLVTEQSGQVIPYAIGSNGQLTAGCYTSIGNLGTFIATY